MSTTPTSPAAPPAAADQALVADPRAMRRILASSFIGSAIEFYDFILFATAAAVVFPKVFFPGIDPALGVVASFVTLSLGHIIRPLGAIVFGHFGDRLGRKKLLILSILLMGGATVLIGCVPPTASVGPAAVIVLLALRVVQGLAVGGEWGGAMLIALEQAPGGKRGFAASFASAGGPAGSALATFAMALATLLPNDQFMAWGWRIPFWFTLILVALALYIRLSVEESPLFKQFQATAQTRGVPIVDVFKNSLRPLILGIVIATAMFSVQGIATVWGINAAISHGADKTGVLNVKASSALLLLLFTFATARLGDRIGRRPVMLTGAIALALLAYPCVMMISSGSVTLLFLGVLISQLCQGLILGPLAAFLAELFPTRNRYTGASTAYQTASSLGGGISPLVAATLVASTHWVGSVGLAWAAVAVIAVVTLLLLPEGVGEAGDLAAIR